jgi:formylglycine-generating enzyme required for sulfatase activity
LARGGLVLLLDALNEMPHSTQAEYRAQVLLWKRYLQEVVALGRGNRVMLSCRSLEYSAPISTPELRVPQLRIEPLADEQIERFLQLYSPARAADLWRRLRESDQLDLLRSPYLLRLLVEHVASGGDLPRGRAALFTGFVRQALRREVRRDNPLFLPPALLSEHDYQRVVRARQWKSPHELPAQGPLFPKLAELAFRLQRGEPLGEAAQVRADYDAALDMLGEVDGDAVIRAGAALALLDEDTDRDQILFFHQLLQEYFAGRRLAEVPEPALVRSEWRAERSSPVLRDTLASLAPSEPLPPLPPTHWEETTLLAAEMAPDKAAFIEQLVEPNLALAGRCAAQPHVREALPAALISRLRHALVARSRDPYADLRARIEAALALGRLGDPRFEERMGPNGRHLLPPMIRLPAGRYPIGTDEAYQAIGKTFHDNGPAHSIELAAFSLGAFPVTNAEYRCFIAAGGYEDDRWWDTPAARDWRRGVGTARGERLMHRYWARVFAASPTLLDELFEIGRMDEEAIARWRRWMALSEAQQDAELDAELNEAFPDRRHTAPARAGDPVFGHPSLPVVGLSWFEARAYTHWLSVQSGRRFRLPTEVEREAAGRGSTGRRFAWGDEPDPLRANVLATHLQRPTPIGVFPGGDTPEGLTDICGNVLEWTSSRWGTDPERPDFGYPYVADDGREAAEGEPDERRVLRGGAFYHPGVDSACAMRARHHPTARDAGIGFRVAEG